MITYGAPILERDPPPDVGRYGLQGVHPNNYILYVSRLEPENQADLVIRAYRDGLGFDLQKSVHEDMASNFGAYPKHWGLKRPDRNIDHRRVPNLQTFVVRRSARASGAWKPGDLVTMMLPGNLPHIGVVNVDGARPLLVHNIGRGTQREDVIGLYPITGHYRFNPA